MCCFDLWICCVRCTNCHQRHISARGEHFVPPCTLLCSLPTLHTHINTHAADELLSHFLPHHFPSTPTPSMAHSASSASGRVAFILSITLFPPSVQFPNCSSFLLGEREKEASKTNLYLPIICWLHGSSLGGTVVSVEQIYLVSDRS